MPSTPCWFGEVSVIAHFLKRQGVLVAIEEQVRFARRRFGHFDLIDFVAVLLGYAISGEATLATFYECMQPFAGPFMALFGRERLPHRSTLSRFLAALDQSTVEALRALASRKIWWLALWKVRKSQAGCGTAKESTTSSSMWMARDKPPESPPCPS